MSQHGFEVQITKYKKGCARGKYCDCEKTVSKFIYQDVFKVCIMVHERIKGNYQCYKLYVTHLTGYNIVMYWLVWPQVEGKAIKETQTRHCLCTPATAYVLQHQ